MLQKSVIKNLHNDADFKLFMEWIIKEINTIDSTSDLTSLSNTQAGEEAKIRAKTVDKLKKILAPILGFKEKAEPSLEKIIEAKQKAGL